jgi:hypothetical protein
MLNQANSNKVWVSELNRNASRPFPVSGPIRFYDTTLSVMVNRPWASFSRRTRRSASRAIWIRLA